MREVADALAGWLEEGIPCALATVVETWRSAPRQPGATMAVAATGQVAGSVSGGCVEGAVYEAAREVIRTKVPVVQRYGVSDDDALAVGLTCGGVLDVLVQPVDATHFRPLPTALRALGEGRAVATATVLGSDPSTRGELAVTQDEVEGRLEDPTFEQAVVVAARGLLARGEIGMTAVPGPRGEDVSVFVHAVADRPLMLVFGAIDFAGAVARIGRFLGYRVVVCDARPVFATPERFPEADEVVVEWPHRYLQRTATDDRTVICVLTHDPKFDVPVLQEALAGPAGYIGAMGSRRTHEDRLARLREAGVTRTQLARLSSPIGLDLGARTPEETAVAIAAEVIMLSRGGDASRLVGGEMAIHR